MNPTEIAGDWISDTSVPMGGGTMRITSTWHFSGDGGATLSTQSVVEHGGQTVSQTAADYAGRWTIEDVKLVVELQGHSDSPFRLGLTEAGELKSRRHGTWRRL